MKKCFNVLALALAALLLALPAVSSADGTEVFIPDRLSRIRTVPAVDDFWAEKAFFLDVQYYDDVIEVSPRKSKYLGRGFECWFTDYHGNAFVPDHAYLHMKNAVYPLDVGADGYALAILEDEDYGQAYFTADKTCADGTRLSIRYEIDPAYAIDSGMWGPEPSPSGHAIIHGWVDYDVIGEAVCLPVSIDYDLPDTDFFRTGMEGADSSVHYERIVSLTQCGTEEKPYTHYDSYFYISSIASDYPEGNYIAEVSADWRNDEKTELSAYTISYAPGENEVYEITYAPETASILEEHEKDGIQYTEVSSALPSAKLSDTEFIHHYTKDQVLCGLYFRNGIQYAVSGSGGNLAKWYAPGHGRQVRNVRYPCTYFRSPRVDH